jgi:hypothetical protein
LHECNEKSKLFDITPDNLHVKINDLAGIRLLHLHTAQAKEIHLNVVGDFQEHFGDVLPFYEHSYLNRYRERLSGIEVMSQSKKVEVLKETTELLGAISENHPFSFGVHYQAILRLIQEVREAVSRTSEGRLADQSE